MDPSRTAVKSQVSPSAPIPRAGRQFHRLSTVVAATDFVVILVAFLVAYFIRFGVAKGKFDFLAVMILAPPLFVGILAIFRLYTLQRFSPAEEFRRLFYAVTTGITGIVAASYWTKAEISRVWVGLSWLLCLALLLLARRLWHFYIWKMRQRGRLTYRTLIVGDNAEAAHLARVMASAQWGFDAIGFVSTGGSSEEMPDLQECGGIADLSRIVADTGAECLFVASSALRDRAMASVTKVARVEGIEIRVSANIPELLSTRLSAQPIGGVMAFSLWPVKLTGIQAATKRTFDLTIGGLIFVLSLVLWGPIAVAIRLGSAGPVVYRQSRVGRRGREFTLLKFRTMREGADSSRPAEGSPLFKDKTDPRVTGVGRFLRRWSLDELPQLFNVFRGDMSLVGPRPPLPEEVTAYEDWQRDRLEVRPGVTGLWQVSGRSELSFDDYVRLDLFYIENWSIAYDLYLLAKTVPAVLTGRGAF